MDKLFRIIELNNADSVSQLCDDLIRKPLVGLDVESCELIEDGRHPIGRAKCFSFQASVDDVVYFVPTWGKYVVNLEAIRRFIESCNPNKVLHNASFDFNVFLNHGLKPDGLLCDTWVAEFIEYTDSVYPDGTAVKRGLKHLSNKYFGYDLPDYKEVFTAFTGKRKGSQSVNKKGKLVRRNAYVQHLIDVERTIGGHDEIVNYSCKDPWLTCKLYHHVKQRLNNQMWQSRTQRGKTMWDYYYEIERIFTMVLIDVERNGLHLDGEVLDNLDTYLKDEQLRQQIDWENTLKEYGYKSISHTSNDDVVEFLIERVGITLTKKSEETNKYSLDKTVLTEMIHPIGDLLLEMRKVDKARGTYTEELRRCYNEYNHYVHTSYNQCGTRTTRLSSSDPNIQNQPSKGDIGAKLRSIFDAPDGYLVGCIDCSQIEVRMGALFSKDEFTLRCLRDKLDMHSMTTLEIFDEVAQHYRGREITKEVLKEIESNFEEQRKQAKNVRFASQYNAGGDKIALMCKVPPARGKELHAKYWNMHAGLKAYGSKATKQALDKGYVLSILGTPGWVGSALNPDPKRAKYAAYMQGKNTVFQKSVADVMKVAMILIWKNLKGVIDITGQIHDELLLRATNEAFREHGRTVEKYMSEPLYHMFGVKLDIETPAELGVAKNWTLAKKKDAIGWRNHA